MSDSPDKLEAFFSTVAEAIPDEAVHAHVLKIVDDFLGQQVSGLKEKNSDLIAANKKLQSAIPAGLDAESIQAMVSDLQGKTLRDYGDAIRQERAAELDDLKGRLSGAEERAQALDQRYHETLIGLEVRAAAERAGVRTDALGDFVDVHRSRFAVEDGKVVAGEQSPVDYVAGILELSPHWYPPSQGGGMQGAGRRDTGLNRGDDFALNAAAQAGDHATYRKLREKMKAR